jgi:predicted  nucleic acid-binding Zn-ribbon protein
MVTLEQVRQLETKIGKAIDYVNRLNRENIRLRGELDGSEKRIAELEDMVQRFREDQGRIEEGILSALERLDQFEDAMGKNFSNVQEAVAAAAPAVPAYADPAPASKVSADTPSGVVFEDPPADTPPRDGDKEPPLDTESDELDIF